VNGGWLSTAEGTVTGTPRSIVAVSGHPHRAELLDELLVDANDYDVIFVESIARGYSRIKELMPDLVIVLLDIDDVAGCQLLSMLKIDGNLADIPVVTCATRPVDAELEDIVGGLIEDPSCLAPVVQLN
jgi:DNA-binding NarL/FixJ family response regulator